MYERLLQKGKASIRNVTDIELSFPCRWVLNFDRGLIWREAKLRPGHGAGLNQENSILWEVDSDGTDRTEMRGDHGRLQAGAGLRVGVTVAKLEPHCANWFQWRLGFLSSTSWIRFRTRTTARRGLLDARPCFDRCSF